MALDFSKLNQVANAVAAVAPDANKAKSGGGGGAPAAKGVAKLRFIGYVEVGKQERSAGPGKPPKIEDQAWLTFELVGAKHAPKVLENGETIPYRITLKLNKSLNEKAKYFKLFKRMNYEGKATHFSQLLGQGFLGTVSHYEYQKDGETRAIAQLEDKENGITIRPPRTSVLDEETGEETIKPVKIEEGVSPLRLFVWNAPDEMIKDLWESLYIAKTGDGDYDPNVFQAAIKKALNFEGSPIAQYLAANGQVANIPAATKAADLGLDDDDDTPGGPTAEDDPLEGY